MFGVLLLIVQVRCSTQISGSYGGIVCKNVALLWIKPSHHLSLSPQDLVADEFTLIQNHTDSSLTSSYLF